MTYSWNGESDLLLVLLEDPKFVPKLLGGLKTHCEEQQYIIDPGDHTLRLVSVKPRHALVRHHVIHCEYELPGLQVEGDGHFPG